MPRRGTLVWLRRSGGTDRINARKGPSLPNPLADPEEVGSRPDVRLWVVGAIFCLLFAFMGVRLAFLQLVDHAAYAASIVSDSVQTVHIPAPRGEIMDRNDTVLVENTLERELVLSREAAQSPGLVDRVAALVGSTPASIDAALANIHYSQYEPVPIDANPPSAVVQYLEEHQGEFPGVSIETFTERTYPAGGALAPHVLGYVGVISAAQLAQLASKGYTENSIVGKTGIEEYYDSYLRGQDGTERIEVNAQGIPIATLSSKPPIPGDTVVLNLDANLQSFVSNALAVDIARVRDTYDKTFGGYPPAPNGAVVVLDPRNGHVLAMASYPSYNLDVWKTGVISTGAYNQLLATGALNNFAIDGLYTPGSTFKLITATAALDDHLISPYTYVDDTGAFTVPGCLQGYHGCVFHDDDNAGLGYVDLPLAITASSDYYFYNLGYQFWADWVNEKNYPYGETPIQDVAAAYGLTGPTGVDLPDEASGIVDSPFVRVAEHRQDPTDYPNYQWYTGDNIEMAFGQGGTVLTPLGLANAYATFANRGTRYEPEVAAAVVAPNDEMVERYGARVEGRVPLPGSTYNPILQGLLGVVNSPQGTAYNAFHQYAGFNLANFPVAGKTGTASNQPGEEPNSWFVGFGPVPSPRYVVLCVIAQGGYGADAAAPVVAETFGYLVHHPIGPLRLPKRTATSGS